MNPGSGFEWVEWARQGEAKVPIDERRLETFFCFKFSEEESGKGRSRTKVPSSAACKLIGGKVGATPTRFELGAVAERILSTARSIEAKRRDGSRSREIRNLRSNNRETMAHLNQLLSVGGCPRA